MLRCGCVFGLVAGLCFSGYANTSDEGAEVLLQWDPSPTFGVAGYAIKYGTESGVYTDDIHVGLRLSYTLTGLSEGETYYITASCYDDAGLESLPSNELVYTVPSTEPPVVVSQPLGSVHATGETARFSVTAHSKATSGHLSYQWSKDFIPIPGATRRSLILPNLTVSDAGVYAVGVSNAVGGVVSAPARLKVLAAQRIVPHNPKDAPTASLIASGRAPKPAGKSKPVPYLVKLPNSPGITAGVTAELQGASRLRITMDGQNAVKVFFRAAPSLRYRVEFSSDLQTWQTLLTTNAACEVIVEQTDCAPGDTVRFYRLAFPCN